MKLERIAIAVLLVIVAGQAVSSCIDRGRRRAERIASANALAGAAKQEDWFRGQLRVAVRYTYQGQVQLDQTQRERNQMAVLAATFRLEAQELRGQVTAAPTAAGDTVRYVSEFGKLEGDSATGFLVRTDVRVWPVVTASPLQGTAWYAVKLAPVPLKMGFACVGPNGRFYVTAPRYQQVTIDSATVSADVCNPPAPRWQPFQMRLPSLPVAVALIFLGWQLHR